MSDAPDIARALPKRPNLENLRKQAKSRLKDLRAGRPEARLAEAQLELARDHGFTSWRAMADHIQRLEDPAARLRAAVAGGDLETLVAALAQDHSLVRMTFDLGPEPGRRGLTLLHHAVREAQPDAARVLIGRGAPLDVRNAAGRAPLHDAFQFGQEEIAELLVGAGAEVDVCIAAAMGFHEWLKAVLVIDPAKADDMTTGTPPMLWASYCRQAGSMRILLAHGARLGLWDDELLEPPTAAAGRPAAEAVAAEMRRMLPWLDEEESSTLIRREFDGGPFGDSYVTIDPASRSPQTSRNANRVYLRGDEDGLGRDGLQALVRLFDQHGVRRFAVWLSPGQGLQTMRARLAEAGFVCQGAGAFPVMARGTTEPPPRAITPLAIREVDASDPAWAGDWADQLDWPGGREAYLRSLERPDFHHFLAFDGARAVASGSMGVLGRTAYLGPAATAEPHRGRGAHRALIAARLAKAAEMGCDLVLVRTEYHLRASYRNLRWAGFTVAYEPEFWAWNPLVA